MINPVIKPACPRCGATPWVGFIMSNLGCPRCGARLQSDLRLVGLVEWAIGAGPLLLVAAAVLEWDASGEWTFAQVMLILLVPVLGIHWAVLNRYLKFTELD